VCVVTGGGTGIGLAIARELAHQGADVVIASRKVEHIGPAAEGLSQEFGRHIAGYTVDIRDRASVSDFVGLVMESAGRIDVLVNNGGGQFLAPAETIRAKGWDAVIETNLTGTWNLTRRVADAHMLEHGGRVINITMLTGRGFPGMAHSVAARAGVEAMSRTLAVEWSRAGINVNCVAPGLIASNGLRNYPDWQNMTRQLQAEVPIPRFGSCEEVAWAVALLAGPGGAYITGQTLTVDGGRSLWGNTWPLPEAETSPIVLPREPWEDEEDEG
jgi:NAD(P)-dependent dehydrogenase (short-subunit alcohol dehydrogenase family)